MRKNFFVKLSGLILLLCMVTTSCSKEEQSQVQTEDTTTKPVITSEFNSTAFDVIADAGFPDTFDLADGSKEAQEKQKELSKTLPLEIKLKEVGIILRLIPAGFFLMGSPATESDRDKDETQHQVTLSKSFWMGKYEITQKQWQAIMGNNPSEFKGENLPVEELTWDDCQKFIKKLNEKFKDQLPKDYVFDLPTEAQWEYACRAGTTTAFYFGNEIDTSQVNFKQNIDKTVAVGSYSPNAWGLYDMHGNVWEWCRDLVGDYPSNAVTDPLGLEGYNRVSRGGGWGSRARICRAAFRSSVMPYNRGSLGFRLVFRSQ